MPVKTKDLIKLCRWIEARRSGEFIEDIRCQWVTSHLSFNRISQEDLDQLCLLATKHLLLPNELVGNYTGEILLHINEHK